MKPRKTAAKAAGTNFRPMKRFLLLLLPLLILPTACRDRKEADVTDTPLPAPVAPAVVEPVFHAGFEDMEDPDTKVYMDDTYKVLWDAGDDITIFAKTTQNRAYRFKGATGDVDGDFESQVAADGSSPAIDRNIAVYPYLASTSCDSEGKVTVMFPSTQTYREGTYGPGAHIMVAQSDDLDLSFRNVGCGLGIKLYGSGITVSSVSLTARGGEKLAGKATVTPGSVPVTEFVEAESSSTVTMSSATPVALGADAASATLFWFALPPVSLSQGFTIYVTTGDGKVFERSVTRATTYERNYVYRMAALNVVPVTADVPTVPGVYWKYRSGVTPYIYNAGVDQISVYEAEGNMWVRYLVTEGTRMYEVGPVPTSAAVNDVVDATYTETAGSTTVRSAAVSLKVLSVGVGTMTLVSEDHSYFVLKY